MRHARASHSRAAMASAKYSACSPNTLTLYESPSA
jgi:hypothetical protein